MLFVINYNSKILHTTPPSPPPTPSNSHSLLTHPELCLVFIFLCHILLHCATLHLFLTNPFSEVEVKSLKQSMGWARREQTQPRICLSGSREGWGGGFLIKGFWILIWKGDGGSYKVKIKNKSFITLTFTRTEPPENKTLSLIVWRGPVRGVRTKKKKAALHQRHKGILTVFFYLSQENNKDFFLFCFCECIFTERYTFVSYARWDNKTSSVILLKLTGAGEVWEWSYKSPIICPEHTICKKKNLS